MVKNPPDNARDAKDVGSIPGVRRSPGGGNGTPLQDSFLENPVDRGGWRAAVHGVATVHAQQPALWCWHDKYYVFHSTILQIFEDIRNVHLQSFFPLFACFWTTFHMINNPLTSRVSIIRFDNRKYCLAWEGKQGWLCGPCGRQLCSSCSQQYVSDTAEEQGRKLLSPLMNKYQKTLQVWIWHEEQMKAIVQLRQRRHQEKRTTWPALSS